MTNELDDVAETMMSFIIRCRQTFKDELRDPAGAKKVTNEWHDKFLDSLELLANAEKKHEKALAFIRKMSKQSCCNLHCYSCDALELLKELDNNDL